MGSSVLANQQDYIQLNPKRLVKVEGMVGNQMPKIANYVLRLAKLEAKTKEPIDIYLNSPGGSVIHGNMLVQAMISAKLRGYKFRCAVGTQAASMAFIIFSYCDERYAMPMSLLLWHPIRLGQAQGITPDQAGQIEKLLSDLSYRYNIKMKEELGVSQEYFDYHNRMETLHIASVLVLKAQRFMVIINDIRGIDDLYK